MKIISRACKTMIWLGSDQLNAPRVGVVVVEMSANFENSLGSISLELLSPRCQLHRMVVPTYPPQKWPFVFKTTEPRPILRSTKANSSECLITTSQSGADRIFSALGQTLIEAALDGRGEKKVENFRVLFFRADNRLQIGITNPLCKPANGRGEVLCALAFAF